MKKITFAFAVLIVNFHSIGQNNPVLNLSWQQEYENMENYFELRWDEPELPHDDLIGYNIYRNNELYRFQTETSLYNLNVPVYGHVSNCDINFMAGNNQNEPYENGFEIHVTAVYNPGQVESDYLQTAFCYGLALSNKNFTREKAILFPNPTNGILNVGNKNLEAIMVYNMAGNLVMKSDSKSKIDLSGIEKGIYIVKLISNRAIMVSKVMVN